MSLRRLILITAAFLLSAASAQAGPMRNLETRGILNGSDGQIAGNIWSGLSRNDALLLIDSLPDHYASPTYYEVARRFLLSDAPALPADTAPKKQPVDAKGNPLPPTNTDRPDVLIARLDKLLEMGALKDAESLYDGVVPDDVPDFDLAFRSLEILMLRGQLSAACLDLQAMQSQHGDNPKWKELNNLCRIQFMSGPERDRSLTTSKFVEYPSLGAYLHGRGPTNFKAMSTQDMAFAVATGYINSSSITSLSSRAGSLPALLLAVLNQMDTDNPVPEKTCLAIEGVRRGMMNTRELITLYEKPHFESTLLLGNPNGMPATGSVHPCLVPAVLYQRIASATQQPARDATIRAALDVMNDLPDAAFWPMALYFQDFQVQAPANRKYVWRASRVVAYEKGQLPESWAQGWGSDKGQMGVAPFWPVQAIVSPNRESATQLNIWRQQWPNEARRLNGKDPLIPLLLGESFPMESGKTRKNTKTGLDDYENILSLTFSRSYSIPSYGLTQRLADVIEKGQTGQSVVLLLIGYGAIPPDQVIPHQMALVIEGLNKAGLGNYAQRFALEVLR